MTPQYMQTGLPVFNKARSKGRRKVSLLNRPFFGDRSLLTLKELTAIAPPVNEIYLGDQDIHIYKIIGSEDRTGDFAEGFLPIHGWQAGRWSKVWQLMSKGELEEPINVLEYGGVYFVRDGHHRISTGRCLGRIFIRAKVTKLATPYEIDPNFTRRSLPNFRKMVAFEKKTNLFNHIPELDFDVKKIGTWQLLEKELTVWNPTWFEKHKDATRDIENVDTPEVQHRLWYDSTYLTTLNYIRKRSLVYLFPGWGETDIVMQIIKEWNSFENPDEFWIEEIFSHFIRRYRRLRFFLTPAHLIGELIRSIISTPFDERSRFLQMTNIKALHPGFRVPADVGKRYWKRLYNEVFRDHARELKKTLNRPPSLEELMDDWYKNVWLPKTEM